MKTGEDSPQHPFFFFSLQPSMVWGPRKLDILFKVGENSRVLLTTLWLIQGIG